MKKCIKMRKLFLIILATLPGMKSFCQINFEEGYYIDNSDSRVQCLIKNSDWESNPISFKYKLTDNSEIQIMTIDSVKEFGILNVSKYKRFNVKIDRSGEDIDKLDYNKDPVFTEETLFLKVLVEGQANLFVVNNAGLTRFFFSTGSSVLEQLICKSYLTADGQVADNNLFRQQLLRNLNCEIVTTNTVQTTEYKRKDLVKLFTEYCECMSTPYITYENHQKDLFNLSIKPGINYSSLKIRNDESNFHEIDFGSKAGFSIGLETEFILPFNKNKWALIACPTFQYFDASVTTIYNVTAGEEVSSHINYKSVVLPAGFRYYMFLNNNSGLFINIFAIYDFDFNSSIDIVRDDGVLMKHLEILPKMNYAVGAGYKYKDRYSAEIKYYSSRDILGIYQFWYSGYRTVSIVLGYSFM